jgi:hypothetical protein
MRAREAIIRAKQKATDTKYAAQGMHRLKMLHQPARLVLPPAANLLWF